MYNIVLSRHAAKDVRKLEQTGLKPKATELLNIIRQNPFQNPPSYEKMQGYTDVYSRRITIQHCLVYQILANENGGRDGVQYQRTIKIIRMWTHYEWFFELAKEFLEKLSKTLLQGAAFWICRAVDILWGS